MQKKFIFHIFLKIVCVAKWISAKCGNPFEMNGFKCPKINLKFHFFISISYSSMHRFKASQWIFISLLFFNQNSNQKGNSLEVKPGLGFCVNILWATRLCQDNKNHCFHRVHYENSVSTTICWHRIPTQICLYLFCFQCIHSVAICLFLFFISIFCMISKQWLL